MRLLAIIALSLVATPVLAQELQVPRPRQGYYLSAGFGLDGSYIRENGDSLGVWNGGGGGLRLGELLTPSLGLGLAFDFRGTSNGDEKSGVIAVMLEGQWEVVRNLSLRGGGGLGVLIINDPNEVSDTLRGSVGTEYVLTCAYDWFPFSEESGGFAVTPGLTVRLLPSKNVNSVFVGLGVEFTWWSGLPQNQLELPIDQAYER